MGCYIDRWNEILKILNVMKWNTKMQGNILFQINLLNQQKITALDRSDCFDFWMSFVFSV